MTPDRPTLAEIVKELLRTSQELREAARELCERSRLLSEKSRERRRRRGH